MRLWMKRYAWATVFTAALFLLILFVQECGWQVWSRL